jgi:hypothetical protein
MPAVIVPDEIEPTVRAPLELIVLEFITAVDVVTAPVVPLVPGSVGYHKVAWTVLAPA